METDEVYQIMFLGFALGIVGFYYYPNVVNSLLPIIALLGAFYLVFGVLARSLAFATGIGWSRKEDWLNGVALLVLVGLVLGKPEVAVKSVQIMIGLFAGVIKWLLA